MSSAVGVAGPSLSNLRGKKSHSQELESSSMIGGQGFEATVKEWNHHDIWEEKGGNALKIPLISNTYSVNRTFLRDRTRCGKRQAGSKEMQLMNLADIDAEINAIDDHLRRKNPSTFVLRPRKWKEMRKLFKLAHHPQNSTNLLIEDVLGTLSFGKVDRALFVSSMTKHFRLEPATWHPRLNTLFQTLEPDFTNQIDFREVICCWR
jgi:hypothetical protein